MVRIPRSSSESSRGARLLTRVEQHALTAVVAVVVLMVAYDNGGYGLSPRSILGIACWWAIAVAVGVRIWPLEPLPRAAAVTGGLLALFAVFALASTAWANSAEKAFAEFNRDALYLGLFVVAVVAGTRRNVGRLCDGIAIGIAAVGAVALASRLFPNLFPSRGVPTFLPSAVTRLNFPVGYWNGLGILLGLAFPLCLRGSLAASSALRGALWLLPMPVLSAAIYLTSSRGAVITAVAGIAVFLAATDRRWRALGTLLAGAAASALAVGVLHSRQALVNGPVSSSLAHSQGRTAALLLAACCIMAVLVFLAGERLLAGRIAVPAVVGRALAVVVLVAAVAVLALSHPVRRFHTFKQLPAQASASQSHDFVTAHLLSGNGSGRWQLWKAAANEFESAPLDGRGAGSYEAWWSRHATFTHFVRNAHSLYLEVLGELGFVGFALLVGSILAGAVVAVLRLRRTANGERTTVAALLAVFAGFAVAASIDWVWQLTIIGGIAIVCLGLLTGPATAGARPAGAARRGVPLVVLAVLASLLIVAAQALPWLASRKVAESQRAAGQGDARTARSAALDARQLEPWASTPYLQLALVDEQAGDLAAARRSIARAIARGSDDWRLWLVAARLQTESGEIGSARRSLERAASLNPRSPLFAGIRQ